jgi:intraflagellar transport protein 122
MKQVGLWEDVAGDSREKNPIYAIAFSPDGSQMIVASGTQLLVYNPSKGILLQTIKAHKETVFSVDYASDGKMFASGGADKTVVLWNTSFEGILKFTHAEQVQSLSFHPLSTLLLSCTLTEIGLWSPETKNVQKIKIPSRVLCSAWSGSGQYFAIGLYDGSISIRNRLGEEKSVIKHGSSPVSAISWNPNPNNLKESNYVIAADYSRKMSFYFPNGKQAFKDRTLSFDPTTMTFFPNGEYMAIGGSNKNMVIYSNEGIKLFEMSQKKSWVTSSRVKPVQNLLAVGTADGAISLNQIIKNTVHGLYEDRYAFRENMTDLVIHHLVTEQRSRIKCRDLIKKISVFKDKLAVQLSDKIIVYELVKDDPSNMMYRIGEKIPHKDDCSLLLVTTKSIVLCLEKKLKMISMKGGELEREWELQSVVRYIKCVGGPEGGEGIIVGLKSGHVYMIYVNNPFPILLLEHACGIRCLDLSVMRKQVAIVDEKGNCVVYDVKTGDILHQEVGATSVAFNSENENMFCYSGNNSLYIKAGEFPPYQQKLDGFVVGFKGSKVFCLNSQRMVTLDVPQSSAVDRYMQKKDYVNAYDVASLGVTVNDWRKIGLQCLEDLEAVDIARRALLRVRDYRLLELVHSVEKALQSKQSTDIVKAEILLYQGKFTEAAILLKAAGQVQRVIELYTDLNMWEKAQELANQQSSEKNLKEILKKKATMQQERKDLIAAANTLIEVGDYLQAIDILGEQEQLERLILLARSLNKMETDALTKCVHYFRKLNAPNYVNEILTKMGDIKQLILLHVDVENWDEAFRLADGDENISKKHIYPFYSKWLLKRGDFLEAYKFMKKAGEVVEAVNLLGRMAELAVQQQKYKDASYYYYKLASEYLDLIPKERTVKALTAEDKKNFKLYSANMRKAESYYAFHPISEYVDQPFTTYTPDGLLNVARFLLHKQIEGNRQIETRELDSLDVAIPVNYIYFALGRNARSLGGFKTMKYAFTQLQNHFLPYEWSEILENGMISCKSASFSDSEAILPICYRCGHTNPVVNQNGDFCVNCNEKFVPSFYTFENLPLVEFYVDPDITVDEVREVLDGTTKTSYLEEEDFITFNGDDDADPFNNPLSQGPIRLNREALSKLEKQYVYIVESKHHSIPVRFYKHVIPEIPVILCDKCGHFFHSDDYEFAILQNNECPFCREKVV